MGKIMFGNELFDKWLNQRSLEILNKIEKEKTSNEDMMILSLKVQTNHFHHMDEEFRGEFKKIEKRFDCLTTILMWQGGIFATLVTGLYYKLFIG